MDTVLDLLPKGYGYVVLMVLMNWMVLLWQAFQLAKARKKFQVKYPIMYEGRVDSEFDRYQRAHQNSLEWNPGFLSFLLLGGLSAPFTSALAGLIYNVGRVYFARGYYKGNHHEGLWGLYALFYLAGCTAYTAFRLFLKR